MADLIERAEKEIMENIMPLGLDSEMIDRIEFAIFKALSNYSISVKSNDLVVYNASESIHMLKMFLLSKQIEGLSPRTLRVYKYENLKFLSAVNKPLTEITTNDVRLWLANKTCSNVGKNNALRNISAFFSWCLLEEYVPRNPCAKIKQIKTQQKVREPFTAMKVEKIRSGAKNLRDKALIEVLLSTGCRASEISGMNRSAIVGNSISVIGKGNKERKVYLNTKALFALEQYLASRKDDNDALFVNLLEPHDRLRLSGIEIVVRTIGREVGVENVHPHRFRHTCATSALQSGVPVEHVQLLLGHSQLDTTMIYAKVNTKETQFLFEKYMDVI